MSCVGPILPMCVVETGISVHQGRLSGAPFVTKSRQGGLAHLQIRLSDIARGQYGLGSVGFSDQELAQLAISLSRQPIDGAWYRPRFIRFWRAKLVDIVVVKTILVLFSNKPAPVFPKMLQPTHIVDGCRQDDQVKTHPTAGQIQEVVVSIDGV